MIQLWSPTLSNFHIITLPHFEKYIEQESNDSLWSPRTHKYNRYPPYKPRWEP